MAGTSERECLPQDTDGSSKIIDCYLNTNATDLHSDSLEPVKKKRKTETTVDDSITRQFMEFSDDVLLLIMSYLQPTDLYAISQ